MLIQGLPAEIRHAERRIKTPPLPPPSPTRSLQTSILQARKEHSPPAASELLHGEAAALSSWAKSLVTHPSCSWPQEGTFALIAAQQVTCMGQDSFFFFLSSSPLTPPPFKGRQQTQTLILITYVWQNTKPCYTGCRNSVLTAHAC